MISEDAEVVEKDKWRESRTDRSIPHFSHAFRLNPQGCVYFVALGPDLDPLPTSARRPARLVSAALARESRQTV